MSENNSTQEKRQYKEFNALVIDDYLVIRRNHQLLLEKYGFTVFEASNGREGLDILAQYGPDYFCLIIVDLVMPFFSGDQFIIDAKRRYEDKLPYIVVCSSTAELPKVKKIASYGIDDYIVKPIDYQVFKKKLMSLFPELERPR